MSERKKYVDSTKLVFNKNGFKQTLQLNAIEVIVAIMCIFGAYYFLSSMLNAFGLFVEILANKESLLTSGPLSNGFAIIMMMLWLSYKMFLFCYYRLTEGLEILIKGSFEIKETSGEKKE